MKNFKAIALLAALTLPASAFADVLIQTQSNDWSVSRDIQIVSNNDLTGFQIGGTVANLDISHYTGVLDLSRVVIKVLQPNPGDSPTITASISIPSGSTTFDSSVPNNRLMEESSVDGSLVSIASDLAAYGASIGNYNSQKPSLTYAGSTVAAGSPVNRSIDITQGAVTIFDSDNYGLLDTAALNSIFRDGDEFINFSWIEVVSTFRWSRTSSGILTATLEGDNTGQIVIEYYTAVPEPSTAMLLLIAGGAFMLVRRRRRVLG